MSDHAERVSDSIEHFDVDVEKPASPLDTAITPNAEYADRWSKKLLTLGVEARGASTSNFIPQPSSKPA